MSISLITYVSMAKTGLSSPIVRQRMSLDLQCDVNEKALDPIIEYITAFCTGEDVVEPDMTRINELMRTKYSRMLQRGMDPAQIKSVELSDKFKEEAVKIKNSGNEHLFDDIQIALAYAEFEKKGKLEEDKTVGDENESEEKNSSSIARAYQLKEEALSQHESIQSQAREKIELSKQEEDVNMDPSPLTTNEHQNEGSSKEYSPDLHYPCPPLHSKSEIIVKNFSSKEGDSTHKGIASIHLTSRLCTFSNILSEKECQDLISDLDFSEAEELQHAKSIQVAKEHFSRIIRTNMRRKFVDTSIARVVWSAIRNVLPSQLGDGRKLVGVRSAMYFYRYAPGQYFTTHLDGGHRFRDTGHTSEYTFILYLNDNFVGGSTRFCGITEVEGRIVEVQPHIGDMLVFSQRDMKHCGVTITKGKKYILQGMVMYSAEKLNKFGAPVGKIPNTFQSVAC